MNISDRNSCTPLHLAAGSKNFAHVELLLNNGSDPSSCDRAGATALHYATFVGCVDTVQTLMRHPDVHDEPDCKGELLVKSVFSESSTFSKTIFD